MGTGLSIGPGNMGAQTPQQAKRADSGKGRLGPLDKDVPLLRSQLSVRTYDVLPGFMLASGVGEVLGPQELKAYPQVKLPISPMDMLNCADGTAVGEEYGWFVEKMGHPGEWEPYNKESSVRLEQAFQSQQEMCTVSLHKRVYRVNLLTMQQLPPDGPHSRAIDATLPGRVRCVIRGVIEKFEDPLTGNTEIRPRPATAPFAEEEDYEDRDNLGSWKEVGYEDSTKALSAALGYPKFVRAVHSHPHTIFTMSLAPRESMPLLNNSTQGSSGTLVVTGGRDGTIIEWDFDSGAVKTRYALDIFKPKIILRLHYSATGRFMVAGVDNHQAYVYATGNPTSVHTLKGHTGKVYGVCALAGETQILTSSMDKHVRLWDLEKGKCLRNECSHRSYIFNVGASPDSPHLALSAGDDTILYLHDFRQASSIVMQLRGHDKTLWDCVFHPSGGAFASTGMDKTVRLWDPRAPHAALHVLQHHTEPVHALHYTPNGRAILSSAKDTFVFLTDTTTGEPIWRLKAHDSSAFCVLYHGRAKALLTCGSKGIVNMWNWDADKEE